MNLAIASAPAGNARPLGRTVQTFLSAAAFAFIKLIKLPFSALFCSLCQIFRAPFAVRFNSIESKPSHPIISHPPPPTLPASHPSIYPSHTASEPQPSHTHHSRITADQLLRLPPPAAASLLHPSIHRLSDYSSSTNLTLPWIRPYLTQPYLPYLLFTVVFFPALLTCLPAACWHPP